MDGGIVDNQGIEPVLLAENRMKKNRPISSSENAIDLIMVCEVASPYMDGFKASQQNKSGWWKMLTPKSTAIINTLLWLISLTGIIFGFLCDLKVMLIVSTIIFTVNNLIWFFYWIIGKVMLGAGVSEEFLKPLGKLLRLKFFIYQNLLMNRFNSVLMLTMNVFLKHVRRLNYRALYSDKTWINRRIMSAIYELRSGEKTIDNKVNKGLLPPELIPSTLITQNSDLAASMGTTLWFTKEELEKHKMLDAIIACGQYNSCWNLLEYIHLLKQNSTNTNATHQQLIACEDQLLQLWNRFQGDPQGMVLKHF
jgi:hypothetical protein